MKHIIYTAVIVLGMFSVKAQTMEKLFAAMPDSLVPVMSETNRLDCVDFYKSRMKPNVRNVYDGKSSIIRMTEDYMLLSPTSCSQVEMKTYTTTGGNRIIAFAYTYFAPARETVLGLYDTKWEPLEVSDYIGIPGRRDLTGGNTVANAETKAKAMNILEETTVCASIDSVSGSIAFSVSTEGLSADELKAVKPFLSAPLRYVWNGKRFVRQ